MQRALLLYNPEATSVSGAVRDLIIHALASDLKLETAETKRRGHASHLAAGAAHEGFDLVVCLGGDGTLNEVANGLVGTRVPLVPLPGGSTNVFARTAGLPNDPIEATAHILRSIEQGVPARRVSVGRVNGRTFIANAGIGLDAAVVRAVEKRFRLKQKIGDPMFIVLGLKTFFLGYKRNDAPVTIVSGERYTGFRMAIVCNSDPYTFLGKRPFRMCPRATSEGGLDLTAIRKLSTVRALRTIAQAFGDGDHIKSRNVMALNDTGGFRVECARPLPLQVDGDYAGEGTSFAFESVPSALSILT